MYPLISHQRSPSGLSLADERASSITSASIFPILCPRAHLQFQFHSWVSFGFFGIGCRSTSEFLLGLHLTSPRLSWNLSPTPGFFWLSARFKAALHCEAGTSGTSTCKTILSTSTFNNQCWLSIWSVFYDVISILSQPCVGWIGTIQRTHPSPSQLSST